MFLGKNLILNIQSKLAVYFPISHSKSILLILLKLKSCLQCFHLQGFFLAARKYWSLQGIYKEIKFTRKWQGKIHKLKEIARISVTYTNYKS
jgi:hypothetical protein